MEKSDTLSLIHISLLVVQAMCDLALPEYTSRIVNVGIQQGGIENAVDVYKRQEKDRFLDDVTPQDVERALNVRLEAVPVDGDALVEALLW